jgi:hypothetical protein
MPCPKCLASGLLPCIRASPLGLKAYLLEVVPFRKGNSRHNQTEAKLLPLNWSANDSSVMKVSLIYPFEIEPCLDVRCRPFDPAEGINLSEPLPTANGNIKYLESRPYAWVSLTLGIRPLGPS